MIINNKYILRGIDKIDQLDRVIVQSEEMMDGISKTVLEMRDINTLYI
jgi:hypothetical protein